MKYAPTWKLERLFWNNKVVDWSDVSDVEEFRTSNGIIWTRRVTYRTPNVWGDLRGDTVTIMPHRDTPEVYEIFTNHDWETATSDQPIVISVD